MGGMPKAWDPHPTVIHAASTFIGPVWTPLSKSDLQDAGTRSVSIRPAGATMRSRHVISSRLTMPSHTVAMAKNIHRVAHSNRTRGPVRPKGGPALPPENWYEPLDEYVQAYEIVAQTAGDGFVHAVSSEEVRDRLESLPAWMLDNLQVVQLSKITRKKRSFPCYGMQWGNSLYLYPIEESLVEVFVRPPKPSVYTEARMYGARWEQIDERTWHLHWTVESLRDFYLNNILIHELGHLLDDRNSSSQDRERYAEWFALEFGYKPTQEARRIRLQEGRLVRRRHHAK